MFAEAFRNMDTLQEADRILKAYASNEAKKFMAAREAQHLGTSVSAFTVDTYLSSFLNDVGVERSKQSYVVGNNV